MTKITPVAGTRIHITHDDRPINLEMLGIDSTILTEVAEIVHYLRSFENITFLTIKDGKITFFKWDGTRYVSVYLSGYNKQLNVYLKDIEIAVIQKWDNLFLAQPSEPKGMQ